MASILVVEDNRELGAAIVYNLELEGYQVTLARDGRAGLDAARAATPDLLILDIMLPVMDGFEVLETLRREGFDPPILLLTAKGEEADKVRGFRGGADQYLTKPFGLLELLERVKLLLRRSGRSSGVKPAAPRVAPFSFGDVEVDPAARTVRRAGSDVQLTPKAFDLLVALLRRNGAVMSRLDLLREVWGHRGAVMSRTVDAHIAELRRKLEDDPAEPKHILTAWKAGYRINR